MDTRTFPCKTLGCPGERLHHAGSKDHAHTPTLYFDAKGNEINGGLCPACARVVRMGGTRLEGVLVAREAERLSALAAQASLDKHSGKRETLVAQKRKGGSERQFQATWTDEDDFQLAA